MSNLPKIRPCPFCEDGGDPHVFHNQVMTVWRVCCWWCDGRGPTEATASLAIQMWNVWPEERRLALEREPSAPKSPRYDELYFKSMRVLDEENSVPELDSDPLDERWKEIAAGLAKSMADHTDKMIMGATTHDPLCLVYYNYNSAETCRCDKIDRFKAAHTGGPESDPNLAKHRERDIRPYDSLVWKLAENDSVTDYLAVCPHRNEVVIINRDGNFDCPGCGRQYGTDSPIN